MKIVPLSRQSVSTIHRAVETVFNRIKSRVLGPDYLSSREAKTIGFGHREYFSLPGLYQRAAAEEGTTANDTALDGFARITEAYLDAERERAKARVTGAVDSWLRNTYSKKVKTNLETVLEGELARVWGQVTSEVNKIVDSQATTASNLGTLEGIVKVNAASGISDPTMFFIIVRDGHVCDECTRIHLLPNGVTPRAWKLSEISAGHHKRGEDSPSMCGLHPSCRCRPATLLPGYGFNGAGKITYISPGWDEYAAQRG
jgi:hypothetical protein